MSKAKSEKDKKKIDFFYRGIGEYPYRLETSPVFTHDNEAQGHNIVRVVLENKYIAENMYFCETSKQWEKYYLFRNGYLETRHYDDNPLYLEYVEASDFPALPDAIKRDKNARYIEDYTAEQIAQYLRYRKDTARAETARENELDANKIPKNIFAYEITTDTKNLFVSIKARSFVAVKMPVETQTCGGEESAQLIFDMKTGEVKREGKPFDMPIEVAQFALEKLLEVAKCFTGVNIKIDKKERNAVDIIKVMNDLTALPFEYKLVSVLKEKYVENLHFEIDRANSKIYNDFCKKAKIRNYRMLKKAYEARPEALLTYLRVKSCGFRDVNIFNRIFAEKNLFTLFDKYCRTENLTSLVFFCKKCIEARGELSTIHILSKVNQADFSRAFDDALRMFHRYFRYVPTDLRGEIYHEGFTEANHNALSEISYKCENKNCKFSYTAAQKNLEDDIDGYSFRLPRDSYTLCDIGIHLHNCVASYTDNVLEGNSTIVYAAKDGEYRICIEIQGKEASQELTKYNATPNEEQRAVLSKWHDKHGIKA